MISEKFKETNSMINNNFNKFLFLGSAKLIYKNGKKNRLTSTKKIISKGHSIFFFFKAETGFEPVTSAL